MRSKPVYWQPGDTILQRFVGHGNGMLGGWPHVVLEDGPRPDGSLSARGKPHPFMEHGHEPVCGADDGGDARYPVHLQGCSLSRHVVVRRRIRRATVV